jgi:hypothetical protein
VVASPLPEYFDMLMDYAESAAWGRAADLQAA